MALGALVGLVVGIGLAFFIEYLDTSVKTMEDVEKLLGVPVLAIIPRNIKLLHREAGDTPDAEAYRILRTNIEFNRKSPDAKTISIVSGGPGEGKSTTLANLAFIAAQGGYSTLIVDADLRRPVQHTLFDVDNKIGLTNYLTTEMPLEDVIVPTTVKNLSLLPSGDLPSDAVGILNSQRMSDLIAELKTRYDIIFFDSPPMLGVSDASVLASEVDHTIIVVQHRRFPRAMLTRVKQAIVGVGGTVLGVVLNNVDLKHDQNYYYYTSYYGYYQPRRGRTESRDGAARRRPRPSATALPAGGLLDASFSAFLLILAAVAPAALADAVLRAGDPVEMKISGVPADEQTQVNNVYTIDANGMVNMPYINKVRAEGLTPAQLAHAIENGYKSARIFTNPTITIMMQPQARFVNIGGAVRAPTRIPFTEDMTLLTAISAAWRLQRFCRPEASAPSPRQ